MRVRITMASKEGKRLKEKILPLITTVEDDEWSDEWELVRFQTFYYQSLEFWRLKRILRPT